MQNYELFSSNNIYLWKYKIPDAKERIEEDEQTLAKLDSAPESPLVKTSYIKRIKLFLFG